MTRYCPRCGSTDIHRSRRWRVPDLFYFIILYRPYRCYSCHLRYHAWAFSKRLPDADS